MPFDAESGQIYNETLARLPKKDEDDLIYVDEPAHVRGKPRNVYSSKGTRSLHDMAMLKILRNLDLLYADLLRAFPVPILEQIWTAIKKRRLDGLRMWKLFAPILAVSNDSQALVRHMTKQLQSSFGHAINQMTSFDISWLTDLTLDGLPLTIAEYVQMSNMPNLSSLAILAGYRRARGSYHSVDVGFSDRILRAWSNDAQNGSFCKLRHILLSGHEHVTDNSLTNLSSFQLLELFCTRDCRLTLDHHGEDHPDEWHDSPKGSFRTYLRTKSVAEVSFPGSFYAYATSRRSERGCQDRMRPNLLIMLQPERGRDERATFGECDSLRCFERIKIGGSGVQVAKTKAAPLKNKRRKLKDGKTKCLGDMLEGFS